MLWVSSQVDSSEGTFLALRRRTLHKTHAALWEKAPVWPTQRAWRKYREGWRKLQTVGVSSFGVINTHIIYASSQDPSKKGRRKEGGVGDGRREAGENGRAKGGGAGERVRAAGTVPGGGGLALAARRRCPRDGDDDYVMFR